MQLVKQSTATTIYVGPVLDSAGAAVISAVLADFRIIKNGTAATLTGATVTHDANGYYTVALTMGNTDTTGRLTLAVGNTSMSMSTHRYSVLLASVFDSLITNATNATGGLATATGAITALAGVISTFAGGAVASVTAGVTVTANNDKTGYTVSTVSDKTGYSLAAGTGLGNQTANITGSLSGSIGSIAGVTFPSNFAALGINISGHVSRVTIVDTTTANTDMRGTDSAALAATALSTAVWTTTIAGRIDVAVSTRLAPLVAGRAISVAVTTGAVELDSATGAKIDAILEDTGTTLPAQISPIAVNINSIASVSTEAY